jgi:hypothetical protein
MLSDKRVTKFKFDICSNNPHTHMHAHTEFCIT